MTCPDCKGEKGWQRAVHTQVCSTLHEWEDHHARYCVDEWVTCPTCRGKGTISDAEMAVYRARGGPAPASSGIAAMSHDERVDEGLELP